MNDPIRDPIACGVGYGSAVDKYSPRVRTGETGRCPATPTHYFEEGPSRVTTCVVHAVGWRTVGHHVLPLVYVIDEIEVPGALERR